MKYQQWNIAQRSQEAYKAMERQGMTDLAEAKGLLPAGRTSFRTPS